METITLVRKDGMWILTIDGAEILRCNDFKAVVEFLATVDNVMKAQAF